MQRIPGYREVPSECSTGGPPKGSINKADALIVHNHAFDWGFNIISCTLSHLYKTII